MIKVGSAMSTLPEAGAAAGDAVARAAATLGGARADLAFVFHSPEHHPRAADIAAEVRRAASPAALLGCTTQAVIGGGREVEEGPAISVWVAHLGGAEVEPFAVTLEETADGASAVGLPLPGESVKAVVMLGDPFTFPHQVLAELNANHPGLPVIGGMASGGRRPGEHALIVDGAVVEAGAVGVLLGGSLRVDALVSQGCKPIGKPYVVTEAEGPVIRQLGGRPPLERLRETLMTLAPEDQRRVQYGLHLGIVIDEYKSDLGPGDFLVRNVMGADPESGVIVVGDAVAVGRTVQFHLRDAEAADHDLRATLERRRDALEGAAGALMFTCNGRGRMLFGTPDHDVRSLEAAGGRLPVAGMFCAGEIGPVGGRNFLHGFTASIAVFLDPRLEPDEPDVPPRSTDRHFGG